MGRKTRKSPNQATTLGEGFHGKAYNMGCKKTGPTICSLLEDEFITKVKIYPTDSTEEHFLTKPGEIQEFLHFIHFSKEKIGKIFKNRVWLTGSSVLQDFEEEINTNIKILNHYGSHSAKFLTILPDRGFHRMPILGAYFEIYGKPTVYIIFGTKCDNKYPMNFDQFIIDILTSLVVLNKANYQHNDIKLDNIVLCEDRYKLIDWGQACAIDEAEIGDMIATSPIKWYCMGGPGIFSRLIMKYRATMVDSEYGNSPIFKEVYHRICDEFIYIADKNWMTFKLFEKYKNSFDVFMLGMTGLHAIFKFKLDFDKYKPLINAFTSLNKPLNPVEALKFAHKFLKDLTRSP